MDTDYRPGIDPLPAIHIRSSPRRSPSRPTQPVIRASDPTTRSQNLNEWYTSSFNHGPERLTRPPAFVPGKTAYDELGRSAGDGVGVEIDSGADAGARRNIIGGQEVSDWYRSLSSGTRASSVPVAGDQTSVAPADTLAPTRQNAEAGPSRPRLRASSPRPTSDASPATTAQPRLPISGPSHASAAQPYQKPIRVNRKEWFIRRALLRQSQSEPVTPREASPRPQSISAMLNIASQPKVVQATYALGPENRGYMALRERGWAGGGLGRPLVREDSGLGRPRGREESEGSGSLDGHSDKHSPDVIDLTAEPDDIVDDNPLVDEDALDDLPGPSGSGRLVPISTSLKFDRLGLGHKRTKSRSTGEVIRKVTHTAAEIKAAQRKAKVVYERKAGKKGKIKWKEQDKRDREERQRLAAVLNS